MLDMPVVKLVAWVKLEALEKLQRSPKSEELEGRWIRECRKFG
jgi:hypothetical protein